VISQNKGIQAIYEARERFNLDQPTREREAREEGITEGEKKGRKETLNEIIIRMNESGITLDEIISITNLPYEEVQKIIRKTPGEKS
jgi:predicted transposase/invertase (TIGR01784 family)